MRHPRPIFALVLVLVVALVAIGCGGDDEEAVAPVEDDAASQFEQAR